MELLYIVMCLCFTVIVCFSLHIFYKAKFTNEVTKYYDLRNDIDSVRELIKDDLEEQKKWNYKLQELDIKERKIKLGYKKLRTEVNLRKTMTDLLEFSNTFVTKYIMDSYYDNPDGFHKINGFVRYPLGLTVGQRQADISNILMLIKRSLSDTQKEDITDTWQDFDLAMEYVRQEYISKEYTKQINEIIRTLNDAHENIRIETNEQILSENEDYNKSKNDMLMSSLLSEFKHGNEQTERMREEYFLNKQRGGGFDYR